MSRNWFVVLFLLFFSFSIFALDISSETHPEGEWSGEQLLVANFEHSGATKFAYYLSSEKNEEVDLSNEKTVLVDPQDLPVNVGRYKDGIYWLHVIAKEADGSWTNPEHYEVRFDTIGPSAPNEIEISLDSDGFVELEWSGAEDSMSEVSHYVLHRAYIKQSLEDLLSLATGAYIIDDNIPESRYFDNNFLTGNGYWLFYRIQAVDEAGNLGVITRTLQIQTPSFCDYETSMELSLDGSELSIQLEAGEEEFRNGSLVVTTPDDLNVVIDDSISRTGSFSGTFSLAGRPNGEYLFSFSAIDDDRDECSASEIFVFDNNAPVINSVSPDNSVDLKDVVRFEVSASDNGEGASGVDSVSLFFLNDNDEQVDVGVFEKSGENYVFDWNTIEVQNGRFEVFVRVEDAAGNFVEESAFYNIYNTFFDEVNSERAIRGSENLKINLQSHVSNLEKIGIDVARLRNEIELVDANFAVAKDYYENGNFGAALRKGTEVKDDYSSLLDSVSFEVYEEQFFGFDFNRTGLLLSAYGFDEPLKTDSASLINMHRPSRKISVLKIKNFDETFYKANMVIFFPGDFNSANVMIMEVFPDSFLSDVNSISSNFSFKELQNGSIIVFDTKDVNIISEINYTFNNKLSKSQADSFLASKPLDSFIAPPILLPAGTDLSLVELSAVLNFNSFVASLPDVEWNMTNIAIAAISVFFILLILFLVVLFVLFSFYFFFIRK